MGRHKLSRRDLEDMLSGICVPIPVPVNATTCEQIHSDPWFDFAGAQIECMEDLRTDDGFRLLASWKFSQPVALREDMIPWCPDSYRDYSPGATRVAPKAGTSSSINMFSTSLWAPSVFLSFVGVI